MSSPLLLPAFLVCLCSSASAQAVTIYSTDFTTLDGWSAFQSWPHVGWAADATPDSHPAGPFVSAPASLNYNNGTNYDAGFGTSGHVLSPPIDLSLASSDPRLRFQAFWDTETECFWDELRVTIRALPPSTVIWENFCINSYTPSDWVLIDRHLSRSWGVVQIEILFDTLDEIENEGVGVFIDDLQVVNEGSIFCLGDGSIAPCPCGNESAAGAHAGCEHSQGGGGTLRTEGRASLSEDTLVLIGAAMPDQPVLYFQASSAHAPLAFGDGLNCTGGPFVRLETRFNSGGASSFPGPGDPSVSTRGNVGVPGVRHYSAFYRDPTPFCTAATFNLTNAVTVVWEP